MDVDAHPGDCDSECRAIYPEVDLVCLVLETPYKQRTFHGRDYLLRCSKPEPLLNHKETYTCKSKGALVSRYFRSTWYQEYPWLCGSYYKNRLFCWPCLLLNDKLTAWNNCGFEDIRNATRSLHKHEDTYDHLKAMVEYATLRKAALSSTISDALMENTRLQTKIFNDNVKMNKQILKIMIDSVLYLTNQELPFHDNIDNFIQLTSTIAANAPFEIQTHYESIKNKFSKEDWLLFQWQIIKCVSKYLAKHLEGEIMKGRSFSFQMYDATEIFESPHCALVFRFVNIKGELVEYFMGFHRIEGHGITEDYYNMIIPLLKRLNHREKMISQYYDGSCLPYCHLEDLVSTLKNEAPNALFLPNLSQHLNIVIQQSLCRITQCRTFFSYILGIRNFFKQNPKHLGIFNSVINNTNDNFKISTIAQLINTIVNEWHGMSVVWLTIISDIDNDCGVVRECECYSNKFNDLEFAFLSVLMDEIFSISEIMFNILQEKPLDVDYLTSNLKYAFELLESKKSEETFQNIYKAAMTRIQTLNEEELSVKMERPEDEEMIDGYRKVFNSIVDSVLTELRFRFQDLELTRFVSLANFSSYNTYNGDQFIDHHVETLKSYPCISKNEMRFKYQLEILVNDTQFKNMSLQELTDSLNKQGLRRILLDAFSLISLVLTLPSTEVLKTGSKDYTFENLKRIRQSFHNTPKEIVYHTAYLWMEKEALQYLIKTQPFYEDITTMICESDLKSDFPLVGKTIAVL